MLGAWLFGLPIFEPLNVIVIALISAGLYGGIPYFLLALWATGWMRGKSEAEIRGLARLMPLLMLVAFFLVALLMGAVEGDVLDGLFIMLIGIPYILVLGYGYVGLVFFLRSIAQTRGWISPEHVTAA
jgi:4-amino-4-deoxy-L-arabinose transferase-like glycosyltransferase